MNEPLGLVSLCKYMNQDVMTRNGCTDLAFILAIV
jgi:hypothetical protein